ALNARSAAAHGATIRNHTVVTRLLREGAAVVGAEIEDARTGAREEVRARAVLNAGGPWAPKIAALAGVAVRIRPGKGVHLTLDHHIYDHEEDGAPGFYSIVGGKLASFRAMAQEAVDLIARKAGNSQPCRTHEVPLPGGEAAAPSAETLGREHTVPSYAAARI